MGSVLKAASSVDVCYPISHGFSERMVLHSGLMRELRSLGLTAAVVTSDAGDPELKAMGERDGFALVPMPEFISRRTVLFGELRPYIYEDIRLNPALRSRHIRSYRQQRLSHRVQTALFYRLNRFLNHRPGWRNRVMALERTMLRSGRIRRLLGELRPRLLISTYPVSWVESVFILEAQALGIPTVGQMLSWDNITAKGRFVAVPEWFLAWGPIMAQELQEYYGVPVERIYQVGVAHFDLHRKEVSLEGRRRELVRLGLNPDHPYMFLGMSNPVFAPREMDIVRWLAARINSGDFGARMQLVVRPHPQNFQGSRGRPEWREALDSLRNPRVGVDFPELRESSRVPWGMEERDMAKLANLLAGCAVSINSGSTLLIESIIHDKPTVMTAFDGEAELPWWQSARRNCEYIHLRKMLALGGVRVVKNYAEFRQALQDYLIDPHRDAAGRAAVREQELSNLTGQASAATARAIEDVLRKATGRAAPKTGGRG